MEIVNAQPYRTAVIMLLKAEGLPADDLPPLLDTFFAAMVNDELAGAAGLEIYGNFGLLRSLVVGNSFRNEGIAAALLREIEKLAENKQLEAIYLLTETAPNYFLRNHYQQVSREQVPEAVRRSSEFSHVCPVSAIVMKKNLSQ